MDVGAETCVHPRRPRTRVTRGYDYFAFRSTGLRADYLWTDGELGGH
jgi:hypothetical protein